MKNKLFVFVLMAVVLAAIAGCGSGTIGQINTPVPNAQDGTAVPNGQITVPGFNIQINAPGPNPMINQADANKQVAGIGLGLWHGVISPVTLIISFMNPNVQMYEVHNDGSQYNLGFLIGVAVVFLILGALAGSRRR